MDHFLNNRIRSYLTLFLILFCCLDVQILSADALDRGTHAFYLREYGEVPSSQDAATQHAHAVFERLLQAGGFHFNPSPQLTILPSIAKDWENWAMSLPDGTVILVEDLLDICFEDRELIDEKGRTRLAFILAHELAHIIDGHHTHLQQSQSLSFLEQRGQGAHSPLHQIESQADYSGLVLLTMAGFEPRYLIDRSNFFREYIQAVRSRFFFDQHLEPGERQTTLLKSLEPLIDELPLFTKGIQFYDRQEYTKAIESFQQFASLFPGREVFNNIGLAYYQLALREIAIGQPRTLYRFMLSTEVDRKTLALNLLPGNRGKTRQIDSRYRQYLSQAKTHLDQALEKDRDYIPAQLNLSSLYLTDQKPAEALSLLQSILDSAPGHSGALNNKAIALYTSHPEQYKTDALTILEMLGETSAGDTLRYSRYNSARIRSEQLACSWSEIKENENSCLELARKSWSPYLRVDPSTPYAKRVKLDLGYQPDEEDRLMEARRLALVIGNSTYTSAPLLNPLNDATAMRNKLEQLGFSVQLGLDLDRFELIRHLDRFTSKLTPDSTALVYYSGHGLQVTGENYLLPVDMDASILAGLDSLQKQGDYIRNHSVSLGQILERLESSQTIQNIIILDACRNNPLPGISDRFQGFAETNAPARTYIAYSTAPGKIAWDGLDGGNGIFTQSILSHIGKPDLDIHELFQVVRKEVSEKTGGYQTTWDVSTMDDAYSFNPAKPQDWTWHIAAGTMALLTAWQSKEEARNYRQLAEENKVLKEQYENAVDLETYLEIREEYYVNQEKMKTHKRNYQTLDLLTGAAVLWGVYLFLFETYDEGIYRVDEASIHPEFTLIPDDSYSTYRFSLEWRW